MNLVDLMEATLRVIDSSGGNGATIMFAMMMKIIVVYLIQNNIVMYVLQINLKQHMIVMILNQEVVL